VVALVVLGALWHVVAARNPFLLPRLSQVGHELGTDPGLYLRNAWTTLRIALVGVACGFTAAHLLAVLVSEVAVLRRAVLPLTVVLNVTPVVAIAPALVVAFGFGDTPKVVVTAIVTFFPVLINVTTGLRSTPRGPLQVLATLRASRWEVLWRLRLPAALPYTVAALRVVLPLSIIGAVVAEFLTAGSSAGLGTLIRNAAANNQLAQVYSAIACLAGMGVLLLVVVTLVERRLLFWHESQRRSLH
jgi:NitT/TauT family transport system permease protein